VDLYLIRRKYDDEQHQLKREKSVECYD